MTSQYHNNPNIWLILGFGSLILLLIILTLVGLSGFNRYVHEFESVVSEKEMQISLANKMRHSARERSMQLHAMSIADDPFLRDELFMKMRAFGAEFMKAQIQLVKISVNEQEKIFFNELLSLTNVVGIKQYQVIELLAKDDLESAQHHLIQEAIPAQIKIIKKLDNFIYQKELQIKKILAETKLNAKHLTQTIVAVCIIGFIFGISIAMVVTQKINKILSALKNSETRELTIRDNIIDAVIIADQKGIIRSTNKATELIFGYSSNNMLNNNLKMLMPEKESREHDGYLKKYINTGKASIIGYGREVVGKRKDGSFVPVHLGVSEVELNDGKYFIGILRDITKQKKAEDELHKINEELEQRVQKRTIELEQLNEKLSHMARHDTLTGLANRALFQEQMDSALAYAKRRSSLLAVYFLDLDGFKQINDDYGHDIGDNLLIQVSKRIQETIREEDLLARLGGDEFAILAANFEDKNSISRISETIINVLTKPFFFDSVECYIGVSIGISIYPEHADNARALMLKADEAMYSVKRSTKNSYAVYGPELFI